MLSGFIAPGGYRNNGIEAQLTTQTIALNRISVCRPSLIVWEGSDRAAVAAASSLRERADEVAAGDDLVDVVGALNEHGPGLRVEVA